MSPLRRRPSRMGFPALVATLACVVVPARAQLPLPAETPEQLAEAVATAWAAADAEAVTEHLAPLGVALEIPGSSNPAVRPAQARAALHRLFEEHAHGPVTVAEVRRLGGTPERGMARLVWAPMAGGEERELPLFLALERASDGWFVTELRLVSRPHPRSHRRTDPCR